MKPVFLLAATFAVSLALPGAAQTQIPAPRGWTTQTKAEGATTFTPPDLKAGERYSITIYDAAPMNGQTPEAYLRAFAGPVGTTALKLSAPLKMQINDGRLASGGGIYNGPNGRQLGATFVGVTLDGGANIHLTRTLFSQAGLNQRYKAANDALMQQFFKRAEAEAGDNLQRTPPIARQNPTIARQELTIAGQKLQTIGGPIQSGVYAGEVYFDQELSSRWRLYIYPNGEYRLCDQNDEDIKGDQVDEQVGNIKYNRDSGHLDIGYGLSNDNNEGYGGFGGYGWCYYGRDASGKPAIYAEETSCTATMRVLLTYVGPPTKRASKSQVEEAKANAKAKRNRYLWVTAPGRGVQNAQIAAVLLDSKSTPQRINETVYLLLRDGSVHRGLPVAPDELDVVRSKRQEPANWGKWRLAGGGYQVSWAGAPFQALAGSKALPSPAQMKLQGRWATGTKANDIMSSAYARRGVNFTQNGRFRKDSRWGVNTNIGSNIGSSDAATHANASYDDNGWFVGASGENFALGSSKKQNPDGAREGDYSLSGYVLMLRYDNGQVARLPFFFVGARHKGLWFEGFSMTNDDR